MYTVTVYYGEDDQFLLHTHTKKKERNKKTKTINYATAHNIPFVQGTCSRSKLCGNHMPVKHVSSCETINRCQPR